MPDLIIGHTGETTVQVWVCGDAGHRTCSIVLHPEGKHKYVRLRRDSDRTAIACFKDLTPGTEYTVNATFGPLARKRETGRFRTFPTQPGDKAFDFSFVSSSCNLPVVGITNLLAYLLAVGGTKLAMNSLNLPVASWRYSKVILLRRLLRRPTKCLLVKAAWLVNWLTGLKQPPPPYLLRSPFLKLLAVFDACMVDVRADERYLPSVGDGVVSRDACGVLACTPSEVPPPKPSVADQHNEKSEKGNSTSPRRDDGREKDESQKEGDRKTKNWRLVLTQVTGEFAEGEGLFRRIPVKGATEQKPIGAIVRAERCHPWYERPSFFIHAGDQIYYDFPTEKRRPDRDQYRLAYREAWIDDPASRYLLSHWPHYMTLDDHEIADQFSRDFRPPQRELKPGLFRRRHAFKDVAKPGDYLTNAMAAYNDYVYQTSPGGRP